MLFLPENIESLPRKERERIYKRADILNASVYLFAENGFENTTIDDIAEKAEYGKGTIYNYFNSKEEIYSAILKSIFDSYLISLREVDNEKESFFDFILELTNRLFSFCVTYRYAFAIISRARTNSILPSSNIAENLKQYQNMVDEIFIKRIIKANNRKEIKKIDANSLITMYRSMIFPYIYNKMFCDKLSSIDIEKESTLVVDILFNGIRKT